MTPHQDMCRNILSMASELLASFHHQSLQETPWKRFTRKVLARILWPVNYLIHQIAIAQLDSAKRLDDQETKINSLDQANLKLQRRLEGVEKIIQEPPTVNNQKPSFQEINLTEEWDQFYHRFENSFRGKTEDILAKIKTRYEDKILSLKAQIKEKPILVDMGFGRGEFLDFCKTLGFKTMGTDPLPELVSSARTRGHEVELGDMLSYAKGLKTNSVHLASIFHVVEHVSPKYLFQTITEIKRALAPGGGLLIETPSVYSLWIAARQFYLDPTHKNPIHPEYLKFLLHDLGFNPIEIIQHDIVQDQGKVDLASGTEGLLAIRLKKLENWLYGPMDMAVWAKK